MILDGVHHQRKGKSTVILAYGRRPPRCGVLSILVPVPRGEDWIVVPPNLDLWRPRISLAAHDLRIAPVNLGQTASFSYL